MMRASLGGCSNLERRSARLSADADITPAARKMSKLLENRAMCDQFTAVTSFRAIDLRWS
jgi:hypothetical protein